MALIDVQSISISLPIYNTRGRALKTEILRRTVGGNIEHPKDRRVTVIQALDDVTLRVNDGDRVGLVGRNGAGKTTLLRVMSRIYPPTSGTVRIVGSISSMTDLSVGMNPEATGYENIIMRGIMLGLTSKQAAALIPDVEEFTELGEYLELPIRTYSAGMMLRLAFAVSTATRPDIIILDEMITAGDAIFVEKARARIANLIKHAAILVLATHDDATLRRFCTVAVLMDSGRVAATGDIDSVLARYHSEIESV
jgi:ABC-2 type transport system ATP-binding protein/lipopolysaccharide transport system ATP-binding protein